MNTNTNGFLWTVIVLLAFGLGFLMGRMTADSAMPFVAEDITGNNSATNVNTETDSPVTTGATSEQGTMVNTSSLTPGQIKLLTAFGIDPNSVTITPKMIACAEASLGVARVEEIKNGATPSITEGAKLAVCYK